MFDAKSDMAGDINRVTLVGRLTRDPSFGTLPQEAPCSRWDWP